MFTCFSRLFWPEAVGFDVIRQVAGNFLSFGALWADSSPLRTKIIPCDNKGRPWGQQGFLPSLGTTISNLRDKKNSTLPWENKKSLFLPEKKKILKHFWAENTGKIVIWPWQEKIRLQPWKKWGIMNVTFLFFMFSFYSCFTKKVDEYNFTSIFMFSSGRQFFSSRFSFFTSSYNFEVNLHEKVGQKIEKACWATYGEGKLLRKKNSK